VGPSRAVRPDREGRTPRNDSGKLGFPPNHPNNTSRGSQLEILHLEDPRAPEPPAHIDPAATPTPKCIGSLYRARYYDPVRSRFIDTDPIRFAGGDVNLYAFVTNSPLNLIDPSGLDFRPGPRGYGGPWKPNGIPHFHPFLSGGDGGALVNPNDPGLLPGTTHDKNPLEGSLCIKCNWSVMRSCMAVAPNPTTVWSCYLCDQARLNTGTPAIAIPACLQCAGTAAAKYGECFTRACGIGTTDGCGKCK